LASVPRTRLSCSKSAGPAVNSTY